MFKWVSALVNRICKRFNKSLLEQDGQNAIHKSLCVMQKDP
jgi:hypothetical protein